MDNIVFIKIKNVNQFKIVKKYNKKNNVLMQKLIQLHVYGNKINVYQEIVNKYKMK